MTLNCKCEVITMDVTVIGTSNSVIGRNGYIQAMVDNNIKVNNFSLGRSSHFHHLMTIIENIDIIEKSSAVIIDHLSNPVFGECYAYKEELKDLYKVLSSLNTNVIILQMPVTWTFPNQWIDIIKVSKELANNYNITFVDLNEISFVKSNFKDHSHINEYSSYVFGCYLSSFLKSFNGKPKTGNSKDLFNSYKILYPEETEKYINTLVDVDFLKLTSLLLVNNVMGRLLAVKYLSGGQSYFAINSKNYFLKDGDFNHVYVEAFKDNIYIDKSIKLEPHKNGCSLPVLRGSSHYPSEIPGFLKIISLILKIKCPSVIPATDRKSKMFYFDNVNSHINHLNRFDHINSSIDEDAVNLLRDAAILLEDKDLKQSIKLMKKATAMRPSGVFIKNKLNEYLTR